MWLFTFLAIEYSFHSKSWNNLIIVLLIIKITFYQLQNIFSNFIPISLIFIDNNQRGRQASISDCRNRWGCENGSPFIIYQDSNWPGCPQQKLRRFVWCLIKKMHFTQLSSSLNASNIKRKLAEKIILIHFFLHILIIPIYIQFFLLFLNICVLYHKMHIQFILWMYKIACKNEAC